MSAIDKQKYSADRHIAEIYDLKETQTCDIELLSRLIGPEGGQAVFEPFVGTGRIALPLARQGHRLVVLDESDEMLQRLQQKLADEPADVRDRVETMCSSVFAAAWPTEQDVVLLGGNCFYEVSSSDEQRGLIHRAAAALRPRGRVFIDCDDHRSLQLDPRWRNPPGNPRKAFPSGQCADGTRLEGSTETLWYDIDGRVVRYMRRLTVTHVDGEQTHHAWTETCHPVVMAEILAWVEAAGLVVEQTFGDPAGGPYGLDSERATVWARRA